MINRNLIESVLRQQPTVNALLDWADFLDKQASRNFQAAVILNRINDPECVVCNQRGLDMMHTAEEVKRIAEARYIDALAEIYAA